MLKQKSLDVIFKKILVFGVPQKNFLVKSVPPTKKRLRTTDLVELGYSDTTPFDKKCIKLYKDLYFIEYLDKAKRNISFRWSKVEEVEEVVSFILLIRRVWIDFQIYGLRWKQLCSNRKGNLREKAKCEKVEC